MMAGAETFRAGTGRKIFLVIKNEERWNYARYRTFNEHKHVFN